MKIDKLKPGMIVYDVHSHRMGNTTMRTLGVWRIRIEQLDLEKRTVYASWNNNPARWFHSNIWSKWKLKEPVLIRGGITTRRPTHEELAQIKAGTFTGRYSGEV